jgi:tRNA 5-methylaminomethyl-2-thiouridine biosynthesis bifunctional protein
VTTLPSPGLRAEGAVFRSERFGDIYFSPDDGLAESRYVFVEGNRLPQRLTGVGPGKIFTVAELGFGTGLNILALLEAWEAVQAQGALHIFSVEGYPLPRTDLLRAQDEIASRWPSLRAFTEQLSASYPDPRPGLVTLDLGPRVRLTLAFLPVGEALAQARFLADAWFLDGFSPAKNPEMWQADILSEVARLTAPGGTAATFTAAGTVRRALTEAGFACERVKGFGRKRHMVTALRQDLPYHQSEEPWYAPPPPCPSGPIAVVGGGIAGAWLVRELTAIGRDVVLIEKHAPAAGASGNPAGLIMPRIDADSGPVAEFYRDAFLYAADRYADNPAFDLCGGKIKGEAHKLASIAETGLWPEGVLRQDGDDILIDKAGVLRPRSFVESTLRDVRQLTCSVEGLYKEEDGWFVTSATGERFGPFAGVVAASGADLLPGLWAEVTRRAGQVDSFDSPPPSLILTAGHYVAPLGGRTIAGATYRSSEDGGDEISEADSATNRAQAETILGRDPGPSVEARVSSRATTKDRHPLAGAICDHDEALQAYAGLAQGKLGPYPTMPYKDGLFILGGLGSRGLVTAPILAAHIAAQIGGGVSPLPARAMSVVHPARFLLRKIKRREI